MKKTAYEIYSLLSGGDRRSIAGSERVRRLVEENPSLVGDVAALTADENWLVAMRALDVLEKLAHDHPRWVEPHKRVFIGPLADSDRWELRLQIVRALPLFKWTAAQLRRVDEILKENASHPQPFVRAWAVDSLVTMSERRASLRRVALRELRALEQSNRKALQARARLIRARLDAARD